MYHFIVNPAARSGLGKETWRELRPLLDQKELPYQVHFTRYQTHATKIAKEITSDGARHILIVLGGDGTVNEVLNGICHLSQTELGYIPLGSGNDLARGLGLPADPKEALEKILTAPVRPVDIGCIRYNGQSRRFIVSAGLGFDAAVCHQVMAEAGVVYPGMILVATDSHTTTHGAFGALGTGVGATDMACILKTGELWMRVPEIIEIRLEGKATFLEVWL